MSETAGVLGNIFGAVFGTVFGVVTGIVLAIIVTIARDKKLAVKLGKVVLNAFFNSRGVNKAISKCTSSLMPVILKVFGGEQKPVSDIPPATVTAGIMSIPFLFRREQWTLKIQYDSSKSLNNVKWIADGVDLNHCPMLPFLLTKEELGVSELLVKEEEEVDI